MLRHFAQGTNAEILVTQQQTDRISLLVVISKKKSEVGEGIFSNCLPKSKKTLTLTKIHQSAARTEYVGHSFAQ